MNFGSFSGTVTAISNFGIGINGQPTGCTKLFTVESTNGEIVNFVVTPYTYFVNHETIRVGNRISGFYDADAIVPFIYPPQYEALVIAKVSDDYFVKVDFFNNELTSQDGQLRLYISRETEVVLENAQSFQGHLGNRNLIVLYGRTTRSIPAQTTPYKVIVLCF